MGRLENNTNIEKIEAMFFKVGQSFPLIPLIAHSNYVHNLCSRVKRLCSPHVCGQTAGPGQRDNDRRPHEQREEGSEHGDEEDVSLKARVVHPGGADCKSNDAGGRGIIVGYITAKVRRASTVVDAGQGFSPNRIQSCSYNPVVYDSLAVLLMIGRGG